MRAVSATLVGLLLGLAGCGGSPDAPEPSGDDVLITYTLSGGLAPVLEQLTIEADGDGSTRVGFGSEARKARPFRLDPAELEELRAAIDAAPLDEVSAGDYVCADCFSYTIRTAEDEVTLAQVDFDADSEANVPPEVDDLFGLLARLADRHAPPPPSFAAA